jgi:hypothetical protein
MALAQMVMAAQMVIDHSKASNDDAENDEDEALLWQIDKPADEDEDEENSLDDKNNAHEVCDDAAVAQIDEELDILDEIELTRDDINLGRFAIHKVCAGFIDMSLDHKPGEESLSFTNSPR